MKRKKKPTARADTLERLAEEGGREVSGAQREGHGREEAVGCAKIMWSADIFPIRLELMYRQYYGDTSKAANPFSGGLA